MRDVSSRGLAAGVAGIVFSTVALVAQTAAPSQAQSSRYSFAAVNGVKAGPSGSSRLRVVVTRFSPAEDRRQIVAAFKERGMDGLCDSIWRSRAVGYLEWPGSNYTLRYAARLARPDGGEDIIVATDARTSAWWDPAGVDPALIPHCTVVQLRLDKAGQGEGKLSAGGGIALAPKDSSLIVRDFEKQRAILTAVRRE